MKKIVSMILALVMVLSLVACGNKTTDTTSTGSDTTADDGQKSIGFVMLALDNEFFTGLVAAYEETMKAAGWDVLETVSGEYSVDKQIEAIENMTAKGVDVIVTFPVNGDALASAVAKARAAGVKVITMVEDTHEWDGYLSSDNLATGKANAWLAAQYIEANYPDAAAGSIPVALLQVHDTPVDELQSEGMESITNYTDKVTVVKYELQGQTKDDGMKAAETLAVSNPDVKFFVTTSNVVACGIDAFYTGLSSPIKDDMSKLSEYACWGTNASEESLMAIAGSIEGASMVRGINIQAGIAETASCIYQLAEGLTSGTMDHEEMPANVYLVTAENVFEYFEKGTVSLMWDNDAETGVTVG